MAKDQFEIEWKGFLETQKLSKRTVKEYTRYFDNYFSAFDDCNPDSFNKWINKNNNNVARAFVKKLIDFLVERDYKIDKEAMRLQLYKIPKIKGRRVKKEILILSRLEVERLADSTKNKKLRLMILATFYLGLRKSELINIRFKDFKWDKQIIKVVGKGNKTRYIPIPNILMDELINYIDSFPTETVKEAYRSNLNFFNRSGVWFDKKLSKLAKRTLGRHVNPHLLRHSVTTYLRKQGLDLQKIKDFLGHEKIDTTIKYSHLDKSEVKKDIIKAFD